MQEYIRKLYEEDGKSMKEIADELQLNQMIISSYLKAMGVDVKKKKGMDDILRSKPDRPVLLSFLMDNNFSIQELAKKLKISWNSANIIVESEKIPKKPSGKLEGEALMREVTAWAEFLSQAKQEIETYKNQNPGKIEDFMKNGEMTQ